MSCRDWPSSVAAVPEHACSMPETCQTGMTGWSLWQSAEQTRMTSAASAAVCRVATTWTVSGTAVGELLQRSPPGMMTVMDRRAVWTGTRGESKSRKWRYVGTSPTDLVTEELAERRGQLLTVCIIVDELVLCMQEESCMQSTSSSTMIQTVRSWPRRSASSSMTRSVLRYARWTSRHQTCTASSLYLMWSARDLWMLSVSRAAEQPER